MAAARVGVCGRSSTRRTCASPPPRPMRGGGGQRRWRPADHGRYLFRRARRVVRGVGRRGGECKCWGTVATHCCVRASRAIMRQHASRRHGDSTVRVPSDRESAQRQLRERRIHRSSEPPLRLRDSQAFETVKPSSWNPMAIGVHRAVKDRAAKDRAHSPSLTRPADPNRTLQDAPP